MSEEQAIHFFETTIFKISRLMLDFYTTIFVNMNPVTRD